MGLNALIALQANSRALGKKMTADLDQELLDIGLGVTNLNILSINYPKEVQAMAEKVAAQSFVGDVGKYAAISMADSMGKEGGGGVAGAAAQMGMGLQMGQQMAQQMASGMQQPAQQPAASPASPTAAGDKFCPTCRKMVATKFCPDCGTQTV
jgi:membrane protease subunit (stomatin/prohibitin family)